MSSFSVPEDEGAGKRRSQATQLVGLALQMGAEPFHTPEREAFAAVPTDEHTEVWAVRSRGFRLWLRRAFYTTTQGTPNAQAMVDALTTLEGIACFDGQEEAVYTRLAAYNGNLYLDLADDAWCVVEITPWGWEVLDASPVRFRRPRGMLPLPVPQRGGSLDALREFLTVDDDAWVLMAAWLVGTLRPDRPFPVLAVAGEQGTGKSTQARMLRQLVDPNLADLRSCPRDERDLMLAAVNGWVLGFDNVSHLPDWLSDALCRVSTGAGFGTRELYSNDEETLFATKRPIVVTSIEDVAVRGDLADRTIAVTLQPMADSERRTEAELEAAFAAARPGILGGLLTVISEALRVLPTVTLDRPPRMADFATWATAAEAALGWKPGTFAAVYDKQRAAAREVVLEGSTITAPLRTLLDEQATWTGTATELLKALNEKADERTRKARDWPQTGRGLRGVLQRLAPDLRAVGISVEFDRERTRARRRLIALQRSTPPSNESARQMDGSDGMDGVDGELRRSSLSA